MKNRSFLKKILTSASIIPLILASNAYAGVSLNIGANVNSSAAGAAGAAAVNGDGFNYTAAGITLTIDQDDTSFNDFQINGNNGGTANLEGLAPAVATDFGMGPIFESTALGLGDVPNSLLNINVTNNSGAGTNHINLHGDRIVNGIYDKTVAAKAGLDFDRVYSAIGIFDLNHEGMELRNNAQNGARFHRWTRFVGVDNAAYYANRRSVVENASVLDFLGIGIAVDTEFAYENTEPAANINKNIPEINFAGDDSQISFTNMGNHNNDLDLDLTGDVDPGAPNRGRMLFKNNNNGALNITGLRNIGVAPHILKQVNIEPSKGAITIDSEIAATDIIFGDALAANPETGTLAIAGSNSVTTTIAHHILGQITINGDTDWRTLNYNNMHANISLGGLASDLSVGDILNGSYDNTHAGAAHNAYNILDLNGNALNCNKGGAVAGVIDVGIIDSGGGGGGAPVVNIVESTKFTSNAGINANILIAATKALIIEAVDPAGNIAPTIIGNNGIGGNTRDITFPAAGALPGGIIAVTPTIFRNIGNVVNPAQAGIGIYDGSSVEFYSNAVAGVAEIDAAEVIFPGGGGTAEVIYNVTDEDIDFIPIVGGAQQVIQWNDNTTFRMKNVSINDRIINMIHDFDGASGQRGTTVDKGKFIISALGHGELTIAGGAGRNLGINRNNSYVESIQLLPIGNKIVLDVASNTIWLVVGDGAGGAQQLLGDIEIRQTNFSENVLVSQDLLANKAIRIFARSTWGNSGAGRIDFSNRNVNVSLETENLIIKDNVINGNNTTFTVNDNFLSGDYPDITLDCKFAQGLNAAGTAEGNGAVLTHESMTVRDVSIGRVKNAIRADKSLTIDVPGGAETEFTKQVDFDYTGAGRSANLIANSPVKISGTVVDANQANIHVNSTVTANSLDSLNIATYTMGQPNNGVNTKLIFETAGDVLSVIDNTGVGAGNITEVEFNVPGVNLTQDVVSPVNMSLYARENSAVTDVNIGNFGGGTRIAAGKQLSVRTDTMDVVAKSVGAGDVTFEGPGSELILENVNAATDRTISLQDSILPTGGNGIVTIQTDRVGRPGLTVAGPGAIGNNANKFSQVNIRGTGTIDVGTKITTNILNISDPANALNVLQLYEVNGGDINFLGDVRGGVVLAEDIDVKDINFNNHRVSRVIVTDGKNVNCSEVKGGNNSAMEFMGNNRFNGIFTNINSVYAGAGNLELTRAGVTHNTTIYGNGNNTLTFAANTVLNGGIDNDPAHKDYKGRNGAVNVLGRGNLTVNGLIGLTSAIGDIGLTPKTPGAVARELILQSNTRANSLRIDGDKLLLGGDLTTIAGLYVTNGGSARISRGLSVTGPANFDQSRLDLNGYALTLEGPTNFARSTIVLGEQELTLGGVTTVDGANTILTVVSADGKSLGHLVVPTGANFNASTGELLVDVTTTGDTNTVKGKSYQFITGDGAYTGPTKFSVREVRNGNILWEYVADTKSFKAIDITRDNIDVVVPQTDAAQGMTPDELAAYEELIIEATPQGVLDKLALDQNEEVRILNELAEQPTNLMFAAPVINDAINGLVNSISNIVITRIGELPMNNIPVSSVPLVNNAPCAVPVNGVSSGDECKIKELPFGGAWISPFYGHSKQKAVSHKRAGYNMNTVGGAIGLDGFIDEDNVIGGALGYADNKLKYTGIYKHHHTNVKSKLASLYWRGNLPGDNFAQLITNIADHKVNIKERRGSDILGYSYAKGTPKARSYGIEGQVGHNFVIPDAGSFTPVIGLRQSHFKLDGYTDKGSDLYSLKHGSQKFNNTQGMLGMRWNMPNEGIGIAPNAHAAVYHSFRNNKMHPSVKFVDSLIDYPTITHKLPKTSYNVGVGTNILMNEFIDGGINYDINFGKKYIGHQIGCKLRVLF